jgi:hypothetical protein
MTIRFLDLTQGPAVLPATQATRRPLGKPAVLGLLSIGRVVEAAKESSSTNAADELLDRLAAECDWVVIAVGD